MSIKAEISSIRQQLAELQTQLSVLESRFKSSSSKTRRPTRPETVITDECPSTGGKNVSRLSNSTRGPSSASSRSYGTLCSRLFKVMQHLINVADILHLNGQQQPLHLKSDPTHTTRKKPVTSTSKRSKSDSTRLPSSARPLELRSVPLKQTNPLDVPRIFHSKRPGKHIKILSNKKKKVTVLNNPIGDERKITDASSKARKLVPDSNQPKLSLEVLQEADTEVFESNNLKKLCTRYSLLKHDPDVLDLLPTSRQAQKFIPTSTTTEIKQLLLESKKMIGRQVLGIWES
ncbi:hypothetical protein PtB15_3B635 [Puccinia triticina]|nr:hypothetical protein PtB15_3B635 [Puccinia triticina]